MSEQCFASRRPFSCRPEQVVGVAGITLQSTLTLTELANYIALHGESLKTSTLLALQMQQLTVEVKFQRIVTMKKIPHEWHND